MRTFVYCAASSAKSASIEGADFTNCGKAESPEMPAACCPHHRRRGQTMIAIDKSNPANAGMTARPVIQVRWISAAVALSRPKLAHETFAAAAPRARIGGRYRHGRRQRDCDGSVERGECRPLIRFTLAAPWSTNRSTLGLTGFRCGVRCAPGCRNPLRTLLFDARRLFDRPCAASNCIAHPARREPHAE